MKEHDVDHDRSEQREAERHIFSDKKNQSSDDLAGGDDLEVASVGKRADKVARRPGHRRHRNEVKESIRAENGEKKSEKNASDDGSDFHTAELGLADAKLQS